jgi:channel protein (hemolysin III family)
MQPHCPDCGPAAGFGLLSAAVEAVLGPDLIPLPWLHHPFSAASHLAGAALFLALGARLVRRGRGDGRRQALLGLYAATCVLLMLASGVYHATTPGGVPNRVMLRLDHGAIFLLIAGTFTPIHGLLFRGPLRWAPLVMIWAFAIAGVVAKTAFFDSVDGWVGLVLYLGMGWFGLFSGGLLCRWRGYAFVRPLLWGGIAYSVGAVAEFFRWPVLIPGVVHAHELFHLAVVAGALLHYRFIWQFAAAEPSAAGALARCDADVRDFEAVSDYSPGEA